MRWLTQLVLLIGCLVLVPGIRSCVLDLMEAAGKAIKSGFANVESLQAPGIGEQALPPAAAEIVRMARRKGLAEFSLAQSLASDPLILQRATEGAWPIRFAATSGNTFFPVAESLPGNCTLRTTGSVVKHAACL